MTPSPAGRNPLAGQLHLEVNAAVLLKALPLGTPTALLAEEIVRSAEAQFSPIALDRS